MVDSSSGSANKCQVCDKRDICNGKMIELCNYLKKPTEIKSISFPNGVTLIGDGSIRIEPPNYIPTEDIIQRMCEDFEYACKIFGAFDNFKSQVYPSGDR